MAFLISPDLEQFLESLERFFAARFPGKLLQDQSLDIEELNRDWQELAALGATAAPLPEDQDGLGMGVLSAYSITEKAARWLSPLPVCNSIGVASSLISLATTQKLKGGDLLFAAAKELAAGAAFANYPAAKDPSVTAASDLTQPQTTLSLKQIDLSKSFSDKSATKIVQAVSRLASAAEFAGLSSRVVEMTNEYVKTRKQFGRTIGSFQAVQHKLADMLMWSEQISSLGAFAAWAADNDYGQFEASAAAAFGYGAEYCPKLIETSIQVHGGIGFTYEYPLHLYLRRALAVAGDHGGMDAAYQELSER